MKISIRRITYDIEEEGLEVAPLFLERIIGVYIPMKRLKIEGVVEINLYGETEGIVVIGECKNRIGPSSIIEVMEKALKLSKHTPDIRTKKIILVVYGIECIEIARDFAKQTGVAIITTKGIVTKLVEQTIEQIEKNHRHLLGKIRGGNP